MLALADKCFPSLKCLQLMFFKASEVESETKLNAVPANCDSLSISFRELNLLSTCCSKYIQNLCLHVYDFQLEQFVSQVSSLICGFPLKILNIVLDGWKIEQLSSFMSAIINIIENNPQLEILTVSGMVRPREPRKQSAQFPCSLVSDWAANIQNIGNQCCLKLFIFEKVTIIRKLSLTALDMQLIDDLDSFYGFCIRKDFICD